VEAVHEPELWTTTGALGAGAGLIEELDELEEADGASVLLDWTTAFWNALGSVGIAACAAAAVWWPCVPGWAIRTATPAPANRAAAVPPIT
jgi:hypothetical protein